MTPRSWPWGEGARRGKTGPQSPLHASAGSGLSLSPSDRYFQNEIADMIKGEQMVPGLYFQSVSFPTLFFLQLCHPDFRGEMTETSPQPSLPLPG